MVYRSPDGGLTWDPKPARFAFIDREAFAADNTRGKFHGRLYVHGQGRIPTLTDEGFQTVIKLYRSLDGGRTFTGPAFRFVPRPSTISGCGNSGLLSDGTLVATVCVHERGPISGTWQSRIVVIRSTDGGETLEREIKVADIHESAMPSLAIDGGSAAFNDRVYVTWADSSNGRHRIFVSVSADQGKSWSAPRAVDDTQPRTDGAAGLDVILPVVKVNRDGVVGVSWYDKRAVPGNLGWDLRFAASLDGGETFTPSVRVSEQSSVLTGNKAGVWPVGTARAAASPEGIAVEYGLLSLAAPYEDTNGMAVAADGTFHPVWVDNRTGMSQVWTAAVRVHGIAARHGTPELANLVDVSSKVAIALSRVAFDRPTGSLTAVYRVRNTSRERVLGPVKLRLVALGGRHGPCEHSGRRQRCGGGWGCMGSDAGYRRRDIRS